VVASQGERRPPFAPLDFDATVPPPPPPELAASPAAGLADGQTATVTGTGFLPDSEVYVAQCLADGTRFTRCSRLAGVAQVDEQGTLEGTVKVRREIGYGDEKADCATVAGGCTLETGVTYDGTRRSVASISFDPALPPAPPPVVQVAPAAGLEDGQSVSVTGSGFSPGATVALLECAGLAPDDTELEDCDLSGVTTVEADDAGAVSTDFVVRSTIATRTDGVIDCATADTPCVLAVISLYDDAERGAVALAFGGSQAAGGRAAQGMQMVADDLLPESTSQGADRLSGAYLGAAGRALRGADRPE
jgi:hypothetical protein